MSENQPVKTGRSSALVSLFGRAGKSMKSFALFPAQPLLHIGRYEMDNKNAAVKMRNISKSFGTVKANDKIWLDIYRGEILALLGENGSGKTTLMNMLSGIYFPDEGEIFIDDKEVVIRSPKDALNLGIGMIHQHFKLVDVLTEYHPRPRGQGQA